MDDYKSAYEKWKKKILNTKYRISSIGNRNSPYIYVSLYEKNYNEKSGYSKEKIKEISDTIDRFVLDLLKEELTKEDITNIDIVYNQIYLLEGFGSDKIISEIEKKGKILKYENRTRGNPLIRKMIYNNPKGVFFNEKDHNIFLSKGEVYLPYSKLVSRILMSDPDMIVSRKECLTMEDFLDLLISEKRILLNNAIDTIQKKHHIVANTFTEMIDDSKIKFGMTFSRISKLSSEKKKVKRLEAYLNERIKLYNKTLLYRLSEDKIKELNKINTEKASRTMSIRRISTHIEDHPLDVLDIFISSIISNNSYVYTLSRSARVFSNNKDMFYESKLSDMVRKLYRISRFDEDDEKIKKAMFYKEMKR